MHAECKEAVRGAALFKASQPATTVHLEPFGCQSLLILTPQSFVVLQTDLPQPLPAASSTK